MESSCWREARVERYRHAAFTQEVQERAGAVIAPARPIS
jgi:hypothetical protein